jgi:AcrR family transcriptional regulator
VAGNEGNPQRRRLTRAEAKARTREQLLDAAAHVFAQKGYAGASVEEIAESAGYSTGALYSNFGGKEDLFLELMSDRRARGIARQAAAVAEILNEDTADGQDPLALFSWRLEKVTDRNAEAVLLQAEFWLYTVRNPEAMHILATKTGERAGALTPLVTHIMQRYGAHPGIPAEAVTRIMLALFQGLARQRQIDPAAVPADLFRQALRWLLIGMRTAASPPEPPPDGRTAASKTEDLPPRLAVRPAAHHAGASLCWDLGPVRRCARAREPGPLPQPTTPPAGRRELPALRRPAAGAVLSGDEVAVPAETGLWCPFLDQRRPGNA